MFVCLSATANSFQLYNEKIDENSITKTNCQFYHLDKEGLQKLKQEPNVYKDLNSKSSF